MKVFEYSRGSTGVVNFIGVDITTSSNMVRWARAVILGRGPRESGGAMARNLGWKMVVDSEQGRRLGAAAGGGGGSWEGRR